MDLKKWAAGAALGAAAVAFLTRETAATKLEAQLKDAILAKHQGQAWDLLKKFEAAGGKGTKYRDMIESMSDASASGD